MAEARANAPHPRGLYFLFFTEMWERFSYYGMRALLVPYMISASFGWQPGQASGVYKWYTSLVYLAPLAGGLLADRFLGLRNSVLIGAVLMAIGHFLMALPSHTIFFAALGFLIAGNGFFKPTISTMVGKMYKAGDERRDRGFTIFYMGINIGAFLASIICPLLQESIGFHWGFGAAGVGMVIGLVVFVVGQKRVVADVEAVGNTAGKVSKEKTKDSALDKADTADETKPGEGGIAGMVGKIYPFFMVLAGPLIVTMYALKVARGEAKPIVLIMPIAFGAIFVAMGLLLMRLRGAQKDKSVSIFIMFLFPVLFWMAFEQAGNALNIWAVVHTDRVIGSLGNWQYPAGWWQSANALMIFVLAPLFTVLWSRLAKRGKEPSTPAKMFWAMVLMVGSFLVMVAGAASEGSRVSSVPLSKLPAHGELAHMDAGRMSFADGKLSVRGVLPEFAVRDAITKSTEPAIRDWMKELEKASDGASADKPVTRSIHVARFDFTKDDKTLGELKLRAEGEGLWRGDKFDVHVEKEGDGYKLEIVAKSLIDAQPKSELFAAVAEPEWRGALNDLEKASHVSRVTAFWLFLAYLLATLGELCLSPVGLSMVTKLAPSRYASLFMGVWLLSSSVAQYVGGSIGESWGEIPPVPYFWIFVGTSLAGVVLVALLRAPLKRLMHEVS
ncbi:MAG: peptide MFS transporter [Polyangiaceae bacterium]